MIHPLTDEFKKVKKGDPAIADGYWMTENYLKIIGDAKIENGKWN